MKKYTKIARKWLNKERPDELTNQDVLAFASYLDTQEQVDKLGKGAVIVMGFMQEPPTIKPGHEEQYMEDMDELVDVLKKDADRACKCHCHCGDEDCKLDKNCNHATIPPHCQPEPTKDPYPCNYCDLPRNGCMCPCHHDDETINNDTCCNHVHPSSQLMGRPKLKIGVSSNPSNNQTNVTDELVNQSKECNMRESLVGVDPYAGKIGNLPHSDSPTRPEDWQEQFKKEIF